MDTWWSSGHYGGTAVTLVFPESATVVGHAGGTVATVVSRNAVCSCGPYSGNCDATVFTVTPLVFLLSCVTAPVAVTLVPLWCHWP